jgi:hypothetical protein
LVVWSTSRVVTCLGFAVASIAIWTSARALDSSRSPADDALASEVVT